MNTPIATIVAGVLIAAAILIAGRWEVVLNNNLTVMRLDRWTGAITMCAPDLNDSAQTQSGYKFSCTRP
jgi:hypothetical protein